MENETDWYVCVYICLFIITREERIQTWSILFERSILMSLVYKAIDTLINLIIILYRIKLLI